MRTVVIAVVVLIGLAVAYAATAGSSSTSTPPTPHPHPTPAHPHPTPAHPHKPAHTVVPPKPPAPPPKQKIPVYACKPGLKATLKFYNVTDNNTCSSITFGGQTVHPSEGSVEFKDDSQTWTAQWSDRGTGFWQLSNSVGGKFPKGAVDTYPNVVQTCKPPFNLQTWAVANGGVYCSDADIATVPIANIMPFLHGSALKSVGQYGGYVSVTTSPNSRGIGLVNGGAKVQAGVLYFVRFEAGPYCPSDNSAAARFSRLMPDVATSATGCEGMTQSQELANQTCLPNKRTTPAMYSLTPSDLTLLGGQSCKRALAGQSCSDSYGLHWVPSHTMPGWCTTQGADCSSLLFHDRADLTKVGFANNNLNVLNTDTGTQLWAPFRARLAAASSKDRLDQPFDNNGTACTPQNTLQPNRCRTNVGVARVLSATSEDDPTCDGVACLECNVGLYPHWQKGAITMGYDASGKIMYGRMYQCLPNQCKPGQTVDSKTGACTCPSDQFLTKDGRCHPYYGTATGTHQKPWHLPGTCSVSNNNCNTDAGYYAFCASKDGGVCNISRCCNKDKNEFGLAHTDCGEGSTPDSTFYKSGNFGECDD